ncbi:MAG: hypothetical protein Q4G11_07515, partial [Gallicola sp.]|nr:hypothetical protein [Gallicola sp.]
IGNSVSMPSVVMGFNPLTRLFASIFGFSVGLLLIGLAIKFIRFVYKMIVDLYISIRWKMEKRYEK